jgi:hypothetical protein
MWSRVVEIMMGCWLLMSPFIFSHSVEQPSVWINDFGCGLLIILFGLFSYWKPTHQAHLLSIGVSMWLIGFAYWHGFGGPLPYSENHLIVGVMLLMFAVIPNDAERPPRGWDPDSRFAHR